MGPVKIDTYKHSCVYFMTFVLCIGIQASARQKRAIVTRQQTSLKIAKVASELDEQLMVSKSLYVCVYHYNY